MPLSLHTHRPLIAAAADFLVRCQTERGDFHPPTSRAGYNEIYDAKALFTLLQAAGMAEQASDARRRYLAALERRLALFGRSQLPDGSHPLDCLGRPGYVFVTGAAAAAAWHYEDLAGDARHRAMALRGVDYLLSVLSPERGFRTDTNSNTLNGHDAFALYALHCWRAARPDAAARLPEAIAAVADLTWQPGGRYWQAGWGMSQGFDLATIPHPTLDLDRVWVLFEVCGDRYAERCRQTTEANLRHWEAIESYYTTDGTAFAECRVRTALAGLMATYDRYTGQTVFTHTDLFRHFVDWALAQFDETAGGFRERQNRATGVREYHGVPAQFLSQYLLSAGVLNSD